MSQPCLRFSSPVRSFPAMADELVLFVESAHKLETSPFWKWAIRRRGASDMERIVAGDWSPTTALALRHLTHFVSH